MLKLLCVFVVFFAVTYALEKKAEITWSRTFEGQHYSYVIITTSDEQTEFIWKLQTSSKYNTLRATFRLKFTDTGKVKSTNIKNLCDKFKKGTSEERVQKFILKTIANVDDCPIKMNAKSIFNVPSTYPFTSDDNDCGPYESEFKIFRTRERESPLAIIRMIFRGNITGCT